MQQIGIRVSILLLMATATRSWGTGPAAGISFPTWSRRAHLFKERTLAAGQNPDTIQHYLREQYGRRTTPDHASHQIEDEKYGGERNGP